jgi:hypothetical protein
MQFIPLLPRFGKTRSAVGRGSARGRLEECGDRRANRSVREAERIPLEQLFVLGPPGRVDDAQKSEVGPSGVLDELDGAGGYINDLPGADPFGFVTDVHDAAAGENVIDLGGRQPVGARLLSGLHDGVRQAVPDVDPRPVRMEELAQDGLVPGDESSAFRKVPDLHEDIGIGEVGLEPTAPASRTLCATRLRYSPMEGRIINESVGSVQR